MNIVEYALEQIKDEKFLVTRGLELCEFYEIREISKLQCETGRDYSYADLLINAICNAYKYGYWQGWKHFEGERPELEELDVDEYPASSGADDSDEKGDRMDNEVRKIIDEISRHDPEWIQAFTELIKAADGCTPEQTEACIRILKAEA